MAMLHMTKNVCYGLCHCVSSNGRDSRRTYCDIAKGVSILIIFSGIFMCWKEGPVWRFLTQWLLLSNTLCWILFAVWMILLVLTYVCSVMRRWQDLDIRIPKGESFANLLKRPRFYEVLATEEGSHEANHYGPAPAENPLPLISEKDLREAICKKLFVDLYDAEQIK